MNHHNPGGSESKATEDTASLSWAIEVESSDKRQKSQFYSARKIILDGEYVLIQLQDSSYATYPSNTVRKILAMRITPPLGYTDEDFNEAELK